MDRTSPSRTVDAAAAEDEGVTRLVAFGDSDGRGRFFAALLPIL